MNMTSAGERLSFFELLTKKEYRITIPIIQRDYAQGRATASEIRVNFLNVLYNYLEENIPSRDLDFVYGTLQEDKPFINFIPLDGQQRLTTLFLLHWYLYQISNNAEKKEAFKNALLKNEKSMFTYETRASSAEFCDSLMRHEIDFSSLLKDSFENDSLSLTIKNCNWFYLSWELDPTIQSMLFMLDAIQEKFKLKSEFFERLLEIEQPIITFLFLNLEDFKLTDDLYIKMNSRGKPLTTFENFKAKFEQYLEKFQKTKYNEQDNIKDYFSKNIDTKWTDLFWQYKKLDFKNQNIDDQFMNFIRVIFTNHYMESFLKTNESENTLEYLLGTNKAQEKKNYTDNISFYQYQELNALSEGATRNLMAAFDVFSNKNQKIRTYLPEEYVYFFNENQVFENALQHKFKNYHERVCFYAYTQYLIQHTNISSKTELSDWMRVIHNLTHPENTVIDGSEEVVSITKAIHKLLPFSDHILDHLKGNPHLTAFSSWQIEEEKVKAHLITKNEDWKSIILKTEQSDHFNGQIMFIVAFSGILEYYNKHKNCNWSAEENNKYFKLFESYAKKARALFDFRKNDQEFLFERVMLTKGDYLLKASRNRKNLLSTDKNNRDFSWKRLLRIDPKNEESENQRLNLVKALFDDKRLNLNQLHESLSTICEDKTHTWRDLFIQEPALIAYCKHGFIRDDSDGNNVSIRLLNKVQSNGYQVELYTYYLFKTYFEDEREKNKGNKELNFFKIVSYYGVYSTDDVTCAFFNFEYDDQQYEFQLYYEEASYGIYLYALDKNNNFVNHYNKNLESKIKKLKFELLKHEDQTEYYYLACDTAEEVKIIMKNINDELQQLEHANLITI